jgi:hypothetical protein
MIAAVQKGMYLVFLQVALDFFHRWGEDEQLREMLSAWRQAESIGDNDAVCGSLTAAVLHIAHARGFPPTGNASCLPEECDPTVHVFSSGSEVPESEDSGSDGEVSSPMSDIEEGEVSCEETSAWYV